ncbi:hypothetical protein AGLY_005376 [Aphis glycines]|uniref:Uncharacterized protein n=1 Tax=Aphis glycines TaxID=307491 RepID=A0A6G0TU88_APHGL|nr:hypothetical protein AGLY_005376 [Aphis glycines]
MSSLTGCSAFIFRIHEIIEIYDNNLKLNHLSYLLKDIWNPDDIIVLKYYSSIERLQFHAECIIIYQIKRNNSTPLIRHIWTGGMVGTQKGWIIRNVTGGSVEVIECISESQLILDLHSYIIANHPKPAKFCFIYAAVTLCLCVCNGNGPIHIIEKILKVTHRHTPRCRTGFRTGAAPIPRKKM